MVSGREKRVSGLVSFTLGDLHTDSSHSEETNWLFLVRWRKGDRGWQGKISFPHSSDAVQMSGIKRDTRGIRLSGVPV